MSTDTGNLAGPELGRAALEAVGWRIERYALLNPDGDTVAMWFGDHKDFDERDFWEDEAPRPHENAGDAIALLEEWRKGAKGRVWIIASADDSIDDAPYDCRLHPDHETTIWAESDDLCEAILRALLAWNRSLNRDESLIAAGTEGGD